MTMPDIHSLAANTDRLLAADPGEIDRPVDVGSCGCDERD